MKDLFVIYHIYRDRRELMHNLLEDNFGLVVRRTAENTITWRQAFISKNILDINYLSAQTYIFPLWLYEKDKKFVNQQSILLDTQTSSNKKSNVKLDFIKLLSLAYRQTLSPEEIFYYIYTTLYSNIYRRKYQEFLKIDFPRIPFTKDYGLFKKLTELGEELVNLHLLKSSRLNNPIAKFYGRDSNFVEKREYLANKNSISINEAQHFDGIKPNVWNYYIGGYQILDKWLKDRKGRALSSEDIKHYCKIITALTRTIEIQKQIDKLYPEVEKNLI